VNRVDPSVFLCAVSANASQGEPGSPSYGWPAAGEKIRTPPLSFFYSCSSSTLCSCTLHRLFVVLHARSAIPLLLFCFSLFFSSTPSRCTSIKSACHDPHLQIAPLLFFFFFFFLFRHTRAPLKREEKKKEKRGGCGGLAPHFQALFAPLSRRYDKSIPTPRRFFVCLPPVLHSFYAVILHECC